MGHSARKGGTPARPDSGASASGSYAMAFAAPGAALALPDLPRVAFQPPRGPRGKWSLAQTGICLVLVNGLFWSALAYGVLHH